METLNVQETTKKWFIAYMGILQHAYKKTITQDEALTKLLDTAWKHMPDDYKVEAT